jgi:hypothetical protein
VPGLGVVLLVVDRDFLVSVCGGVGWDIGLSQEDNRDSASDPASGTGRSATIRSEGIEACDLHPGHAACRHRSSKPVMGPIVLPVSKCAPLPSGSQAVDRHLVTDDRPVG